ncbi:MAG: helix-turn-helix transcriptional regulator [Acidobacteriota bacterium]
MKITSNLTDGVIFSELGRRLAEARLERNLTQAALAEEAGISKRTLERLESGAASTQLSAFIRICRALGLLERFDALISASLASPVEQLKLLGKKRKRASGKKLAASKQKKWTWGERS